MGLFGLVGATVLLGYGGWEVARSGFRQPPGWQRLLAASVLSWAWFTIGLQVLGSIGFLTGPAILALCAAGAAVAGSLRWRRGANDDSERVALDWNVAAIVSLALLLAPSMFLCAASLLGPPKIISDGPIYHLFFAAKWWKAGRIFLIASPFGENAASYFPANGDLLFSGLMALYGGDRPARIGQVPFLFVCCLAAYGLARKLGASAPSAVIATCLFGSSVMLLFFSFEANVDTIFVAGYLATTAFGVLYVTDGRDIKQLVLAGLAAGTAWGTKPTATAFLPPLLLVVATFVLSGPKSRSTKLRHLIVLALATLVPCCYWFGRSALLTGNPLYPMHLELRGHVILRGWYNANSMQYSQFYLPSEDWRALVSIVLMVFDARVFPLFALALTGGWAIGKHRAAHPRLVWLLSVLAVLNVAIFWLAIPYRTQHRFIIQATGLSVPALALLLDRSRFWRWLAVALLVVHVQTAQNWPWSAFRPNSRAPWELSIKIPRSVDALFAVPVTPLQIQAVWDSKGGPHALLAYGIILAGSLLTAFCFARAARRPTPVRSLLAGVTLIATLFGTCWTIDAASDFSLRNRIFPRFDDYQRAWFALERLSPPEGTRVAYAGTNLPYFLMCGNLRNDVFYININAHPDWLMHDYHRTAAERGDPLIWNSPRPGWDRIPAHADYSAWLANLRQKRIRILVVAKANPADGPFNIADQVEHFTIERIWADTHPEVFTRVYPSSEPDPKMRIYLVSEK